MSPAYLIDTAFLFGVAIGAWWHWYFSRARIADAMSQAKLAIAAADEAARVTKQSIATRPAPRFRCPVCPHPKADHGPTGCTQCGCRAIPS